MGEDLDKPEKWVPYLSVMQRLARLNSSAVALAISQNGTRLTQAHRSVVPVAVHKQKVGGEK